MSTQSDLAELYTAFFNRAPDSAGLAYWVNQLNSGTITLGQIAKNWVESQPEGQAKYPAGMSTTDFVNAIYDNVLSRTSDAAGLAYWQAQLDSGAISRDTFVATVINGAKANTSTQGKADAALLSNKASVGIAFADKGLNDVTLAAKVLTSVTADSNTLTATLDLIKLVPSAAGNQTPAVLTALNTALTNVANLIKTAPGEVADLATYLTAVANGVTGNTNLATLFASINTKVVAAQTNPAALDNPATQAGTDVTAATPSTGGGDTGTPPVTVPTFTVTNSTGEDAGIYIVGTKNGLVTISLHGDDVVFTPKTGTAVTIASGLITQGLNIAGSVTGDISILDIFGNVEIVGNGNVAVTGSGVITAAQLNLVDNHSTAKLNFTAFEGTIRGTQEELLTALSASGLTGLGDKAVAITESPTIAQVKAVDDKTSGVVTANSISDTAAHLKANAGGYVKAGVAVNVSDDASIAQLTAINVLTGALAAHGTVVDNVANLALDLDAEHPLVQDGNFIVNDSLENVLTAIGQDTLPEGFDYTLTSGNVTVPSDVHFSVTMGQQALEFFQAAVENALNVVPVTLNATFTLYDTVENLTAALNNHLAVMDGNRPYVVNDTLLSVLAAKADVESPLSLNHYTLTDASIDLGDNLSVANATLLKAQAQAVVDGAENEPALSLDAGYTVTDTVANLLHDVNSDFPVTAGHDYSVSDTLTHIVADKGTDSDLTYTTYSLTDTSFDAGSDLTVQALIAAELPVQSVYAGATGDNTPLVFTYSLADTVEHLVANAPLLIGHDFTVNDSLANIQAYLGGDTAALGDDFAYNLTSAHIEVTASIGVEAALALQEQYTDLVNGAVNKAAVTLDIVFNLHGSVEDLTDTDYTSVVVGQHVQIDDEFISLDDLAAVQTAVGTGTNAGVDYNGIKGEIADLLGAGELIADHAVSVSDALSIADLTELHQLNVSGVEYGVVSDSVAVLIDQANSQAVAGKILQVTGDASVADIQAVEAAAGNNGSVAYGAVTDSVANLINVANAGIVELHDAVIIGTVSIQNITDVRNAVDEGTVTYGAIADSVANLTDAANLQTITGHALTVNDAASIAQLVALKDAAGIAGVTYTSVFDTYAHLTAQDAAGLLTDKVVSLTDDAVSIAQLTTITSAGAIIAGYNAVTDTFANLTSNVSKLAGHAVIITDAVSVSQVGSVKAINSIGAVTYTTLSDNAANLDAASSDILGAAGTVSFTDAATIAQLTNVDGKTAATLAYTSVTDSAATLVSNTGGYVKNAVNVTVSDTATLGQLTIIDLETTGSLTATNIADAAATLVSNVGGYIKAGVNVTVNDAATLAQLTSIDGANGTGTLTANTVADNAALLAANAGNYIKAGVAVNVLDDASISQLTAIDGLNGNAALTYGSIKDAAATLVSNTGLYVNGSVNVTVSDAATLAQLSTIDLKTSGTLTANLIQDGIAALTTNSGSYVKAGVNVTVTDSASIAQLTVLDGVNGTGTVAATTVTDSASALFDNTGGYVKDAVNVVVSGAATVAQLANIDGKNGAASLTYTSVSDTAALLLANINGSATHYVVDGTNVNVTDAVSLSTLATIDGANGAGTLTAASVIDTAAHLVAITPYIGNSTNVEITGVVDLADLKTIDDKSATVTYNEIADSAAALHANTDSYIHGSVKVTVIGGISMQYLYDIQDLVDSPVTYTKLVDTANTLTLDAQSANGHVKGDIAVEVTTTISLADLNTIDQKITGELTYASITDTGAHLAADTLYIKGDVDVFVSGAIDLADLTAISTKTTGDVEYHEVSGNAADLAIDALTNGGNGTFVVLGMTVDVTDAASVQQLADIKAATGTNPNFHEVADTGSTLAGDALFVSLAAKVTVTDAASLGDLTTISDNMVDPTQLSYTAVKDTAQNLVAHGAEFLDPATDINVTVSDAATVASLAAITAMTGGTVTAANLADTHLNLFTNGVLTSYVAVGSTVTVQDDATVAELKALVAATGDASKVIYTALTDSIANLTSADAAAFIKPGVSVSITDNTATVAQVAAIDAANGVDAVNYQGVTDTAAALAADAVAAGTKYSLNKTVVVTDAATIEQLAAIDLVSADLEYTKVTDTAANLATNAGTFVQDGITVSVSDAATVAQLATIDGFTDVALAYTKVTDTAAHLVADSTYVKAGVTVTLTDTGTVAAATLASIDGKTDVQVDASSVGTVTGNIADVKAALAASATLKLSGTEGLVVTDTAADLAGQTLSAGTSSHDVLNVGLASVTTNLSGLTGFEDIYLAGSNRSTNAITIGDGDGVSVHAQAASNVILGSGHQSFFTSTGNDSVTMNTASTFVFAASAAANGVDLVKNFSVGAAGSALDFSSFLGGFSTAGSEIVNDASDFGGGAGVVTLLDGNSLGLASKNAISVTDFNSSFLSKVDGKEVVVTFDNTAHSANVYFVNSAGGGAAGVVDSAADITLVGTVTYTGSISTVNDLHLASHLAIPL
ncbi:DUF4214 domain-containing protein [Pseudomonas sp. NPDC087358]|uniref:DUF4214 domain-containing protein n=1 Tax=Pseudomonas sp. NPDC087358 TaxID=3364439 RepID=UPI00385147EC